MKFVISLQLTEGTESCGIPVDFRIFNPSSSVVAVSVIYTLQEPLSRMERVNFLVSTPEIPGISKVFITSDSVETPLKLDGSSLYSRTISAPMVGISRS